MIDNKINSMLRQLNRIHGDNSDEIEYYNLILNHGLETANFFLEKYYNYCYIELKNDRKTLEKERMVDNE